MFTVLFTGSNCDGKSKIAKQVQKLLVAKGLTVVYLDKYNSENTMSTVCVADLLNKQGVAVVASFKPFAGLHKFAKNTIIEYLEVWVTGADKTHVFSVMHSDIRVDVDINSIESCAKLVVSYLYLHKILFLSKGAEKI